MSLAESDQRVAQVADPVVVLEGLHKSVDGVVILDGVSLVARPSRVTAVLGPNGAGKSTALRALLGLVIPDAGRVVVGGQVLKAYPIPARVVGASLGTEQLHSGRTAFGQLRVVAAATGFGPDRVTEVLRVVGISELARVRIGDLSLGMRQRLALACALLPDPEVLVLDEPHNGLDAEGISWLREVLAAFVAAGRTVIVSSHLLGELQEIADDVVVLDRGRVVAAGPVDELLGDRRTPGALERWYFDRIGVR